MKIKIRLGVPAEAGEVVSFSPPGLPSKVARILKRFAIQIAVDSCWSVAQVDLGAVCAVFPYGKILPIEVVQPGGLSFQVSAITCVPINRSLPSLQTPRASAGDLTLFLLVLRRRVGAWLRRWVTLKT